MAVFHSDPYLFSMALRAVGNLTRTDENIVRAVGYGVITSIVRGVCDAHTRPTACSAHHACCQCAAAGMLKLKTNASVVQLAADVMGNLASLDENVVNARYCTRFACAVVSAAVPSPMAVQHGPADIARGPAQPRAAGRRVGADTVRWRWRRERSACARPQHEF